MQFQITAVLTLCWDTGRSILNEITEAELLNPAVAGQRLMYGTDPPGRQISVEDVEEVGRLRADEV